MNVPRHPIDPFPRSLWPRVALLALAAYVVYAGAQMDVAPDHLLAGMRKALRAVPRLVPPDFAHWDLIAASWLQTLACATIATALGGVLGWGLGTAATRGRAPAWLAWPVRGFLAVLRALHPWVGAFLLVAALGPGLLAGVIALAIASAGLLGARFAAARAVAVSATDAEGDAIAAAIAASPLALVAPLAAVPLATRVAAIAMFALAANVRLATMLGLVGAGGIGALLLAAWQAGDWPFVAAIALAIVGGLLLVEALTTAARFAFRGAAPREHDDPRDDDAPVATDRPCADD